MLLAVLLFFGGTAAVPSWTPGPDGPVVAAPQTHDLVTGRQAAPRAPSTAPVPWALTPASPLTSTTSWRTRVERTGEAPPDVAPSTSRSTRAPPSFAS
ncbi:hypothetical protein [Amycolatopsis sp. NPDC004378]